MNNKPNKYASGYAQMKTLKIKATAKISQENNKTVQLDNEAAKETRTRKQRNKTLFFINMYAVELKSKPYLSKRT